MIVVVAKGVQTGLYLSGQPVLVKECNIIITQPKVKDIVVFGEDEFLIASNLITKIDRTAKMMREGNPQLERFDDFQILLVMMKQEPDIKQNIEEFLNFICIDYEIKTTEANFEF